MEKKSLKSIFFKRMLYGDRKLDIKGTDAIFLVLCTLVEIGFPMYFLMADYKMEFPYNIIFLFGTIFALFFIFMDLRTFFQSNYIDLLFFQICTYIVFMLIALVVFVMMRWEVALTAGLGENSLSVWMITIVAYVIFLCGTFICVFAIDFLSIFVLVLLAAIFQVDTQNPYMEKLQYAQTIEGSEEYTRLRIKGEYEDRFQESSIDEAAFEQYCKEQYKNPSEPFVQAPLFENTKHFKKIVSLDQVKARYDMLMKIYRPADESAHIPEICKEIEKEYKEIKKKYNIKD